MRKVIDEGCRIPKFYGVAWDLFTPRKNSVGTNFLVVCYPIPLNLIFRAVRNVYLKLHQLGRLSDKDMRLFTESILEETRKELHDCRRRVQMLWMLNTRIDRGE